MNISIVSINMKLSIERHSVMMFIFPTCVCLLLTHWACLLSLRNMYKCLRHNSASSTALEYEPWLALEYAQHWKYCNMNGSHWDTNSSLEYVTFILNIQRMQLSQKLETACTSWTCNVMQSLHENHVLHKQIFSDDLLSQTQHTDCASWKKTGPWLISSVALQA